MKKLVAAMTAALSLAVLGLTGCTQSGAKASTGVTVENSTVPALAHDLSETHTIHIVMTEFADKVEERTSERIQVCIFPNSQLGSENRNMEQLMAGVTSMTKASAPGLATYNESYHTFGPPYIFDDTEDLYHVMDSGQMQDFSLSSPDDGSITLTCCTSGTRSLHTKNKATHMLADPGDPKIRVQDTKSQTDMAKALGGIPVAMSYGNVYTSLQTGIIDSIEGNEMTLATGKHGEVCKIYSTDQYAMIPDVIVMDAKMWKTVNPQGQQITLKVARESTESHKIAWGATIDEAIQEASTQVGVEFVNDVDKDAFRQTISGIINECYAQYPGVKELLDIIDSVE